MAKLNTAARALVAAARRSLRPTDADRVRIWDTLSLQLGNADLAQSSIQLAAPSVGSLWPKLWFLAAGAGAVVMALSIAEHQTRTPLPTPVERQAVPVEAKLPAAPDPGLPIEAAPAAQPETELASVRRSPAKTAAKPELDSLREEAALLSLAQKELLADRLNSAISLVDEHHRKFPNGQLKAERAILVNRLVTARKLTSQSGAGTLGARTDESSQAGSR